MLAMHSCMTEPLMIRSNVLFSDLLSRLCFPGRCFSLNG